MHPKRLMRPPLDSPDSADNADSTVSVPGRLLVAPQVPAASHQENPVGRDFRDALGSFATGVTVLTALAPDGQPVGVTISSFNSVSLQPPLILWSLACESPRLEAFRQARHYAVNVLAVDQVAVSDRFASREDDRFGGVRTVPGMAGVPLIEGCTAWFECSNEAHYPGGDHLIFLGRVQRFARGKGVEPLIFHGGRYRILGDESGP
jgi:flavin reductase (DIM6/NTAB) family NADH-FMN oxidoreductase RutF